MKVSHSNMKAFQKCEFAFYLNTILKLRPKEYPEALEVGTFGHTIMEAFFQAIMKGKTYEEASAVASQVVAEIIKSDDPLRFSKAKVLRNVLAFGAYFMEQPWKVVALEDRTDIEVFDGQEFAFTPDIVCEWTTGPKRGLPFLLDYKFTGQYWTDRQINVVQQMPKYLHYYNKKHGTKMRHCGVVMLNTRADATATGYKLFLLKWIPVTKEKLLTIERENEILLKRVEPLFSMEPDEVKKLVVRTTDEYGCRMCWFADDLCPMDMNGQDITRAAAANYVKNDYGYN